MAFGQALTAAAKKRASEEAAARGLSPSETRRYLDRRVNQLRRDAAFHAILVRLGSSASGQWVVKGGVALQLRLDPSRPSLDIDVAWVGPHLGHAAALENLRRTLAAPADDFFTFEVQPRNAAEDDAGSLVVPVVARLGVNQFERFSVDIAPAREEVASEIVSGVPPPLDLEQLGRADIALLAIESQIADKVCAMNEERPGGHSSRWRDLADLAMISTQLHGIDAVKLAAAIQAEAARRSETLPRGLPAALSLPDAQLREWRRAWGKGGRDVPISIDDSLSIAAAFLDPILSGGVSGTWRPDARSWESV